MVKINKRSYIYMCGYVYVWMCVCIDAGEDFFWGKIVEEFKNQIQICGRIHALFDTDTLKVEWSGSGVVKMRRLFLPL